MKQNQSMPIVPVILCGGMGSRLWPVSRSKFPKQFMGWGTADGSYLQQTVKRVTDERFARPVVVSNADHRFLVAEHLFEIGVENADILLEPMMRNTAPAITAAALHIQSLYPNALMLVLASDHVIKDVDTFSEAVDRAAAAAREGKLVTFGIEPEYAETGYGYILKGEEIAGLKGVNVLKKFVEKPDADTASSYVKSGDYLWNSGMFVFPVGAFLKEISTHHENILTACGNAVDGALRDSYFIQLDKDAFAKAENISVDYAVMEKTASAAVVPVACGWSDAGAWDALWRIGEKDEAENVVTGTVFTRDTRSSYLQVQGGAPIATLGVEDLVVVSTKDVVMVAPKDRAQDVKKLMEQVGTENQQLVEHHQRVFRPWGCYETIELGGRHQVKHITVKPGAKLSVQMHHHRAEHWTIVSGTAKVFCDGKEHILTENQYIFIPLGGIHAIENIGKVPLEFIEVQVGSYLGEDDIVRFEDRYGRAPQ
jgi:mannose-1-phosphate guanylyltransferase/mannose-6-phosphate isomerase